MPGHPCPHLHLHPHLHPQPHLCLHLRPHLHRHPHLHLQPCLCLRPHLCSHPHPTLETPPPACDTHLHGPRRAVDVAEEAVPTLCLDHPPPHPARSRPQLRRQPGPHRPLPLQTGKGQRGHCLRVCRDAVSPLAAARPPWGVTFPFVPGGTLTHGAAAGVPKPAVVLGCQEPADHLLPHPFAVDAQRQHAQAVLVVTGEGVAMLPGSWGRGVVSPGRADGPVAGRAGA